MRMRAMIARLMAGAARPLSWLFPSLAGTTAVSPLTGSFYDVAVPAADGTSVDLGRFRGQVSLVVNVASHCGFTPQYAGLQALQSRYAAAGFSVLAFPSNEFGAQEPGTSAEIQEFCATNFRVSFPLFAKTHTRPGPEQSPAYGRLAESGHIPRWNFHKYLVGRDGQVKAVFPSVVAPDSAPVRRAVERALSAGG